jgi:exosortase
MAETLGTLHQLVFFAVVVALVVLERVGALQRFRVPLARRWTSNIGLYVIGGVVGAIIVPLGVYAFAAQQPPGVMERAGVPYAAQFMLAFLFLDFWRYWEHRAFHAVPLLWRLHLVHHSDTHVDVTTTERHHPIEVVLSTLVLLTLIVVLGLPAAALAAYLVVAEVVALYSHANVRAPAFLDALIVTPSMHAVHHSDSQPQTDSNFGSVLTIWDRWFGTYVDPRRATIPHFGLRYFHLPADTRLARVLLQPFFYRRDLAYPDRVDEAWEPARWPRPSDVLVASLAGVALVTAAMWPAVAEMAARWRHSEAYQYGWLVVPMVVYVLAWHWRGARLDARPGYGGACVVIVAAVCFVAADLMSLDVGRQFAFVLALQGVAMTSLGWRAYWRVFPALALLFLMIPSGDLLQPPLRAVTAKSIEMGASLFHLPYSSDGYFVAIGTHRYFVADECSGLTYVTLAGFLGYCFGLLLYRSFYKIAAMALFGALLAVACNMLRVNAIVLVDWLRDTQMPLTAHGAVQWVMLLAVLGILFFVLHRSTVERAPAVAADAPTSSRMRKFAPVAAGACAVVIAGAAPGAQDDSVATTESTYQRDGRQIRLVVVESDAKLPESKLAPADAGVWREKIIRSERGCVATHCIEFRHAIWQRTKTHEVRHVYFVYNIGGFVTDSRLALRAAHGWHRWNRDAVRPRLIAFLSETALDAGDLAGMLRTFLAQDLA